MAVPATGASPRDTALHDDHRKPDESASETPNAIALQQATAFQYSSGYASRSSSSSSAGPKTCGKRRLETANTGNISAVAQTPAAAARQFRTLTARQVSAKAPPSPSTRASSA